YNTDAVSESEVPTSWNDLLDPRWKGGKIEMSDPTVLGGIRFIFADMQLPDSPMKDQARDFITGLAAQKPHITSEEPSVASDVTSGRFEVGIGVYKGFYDDIKRKDPDAPIGFQFPMKEGNEMIQAAICQIQDAPHEDAAALLLNWLFTPEGQKKFIE